MKKYLFVYLLMMFFSCKDQQKKEIVDVRETAQENVIEVKDSLLFSDEGKIINVSHFENNIREGFSLILDEKTNLPKYLVEYNQGKRDKVIIAFNEDGKIKSFRSADIYHDGQRMDFHKSGALKEVGNTVKGKANGICYYFDEEGKLVKEVIYEKGQVID
jgi:antitoxin component YwqK of YwqJK toxin-antitoxin module